MIIWLHQLKIRNLYANSGNTASAQSYTLLMSTRSEQQPMNPAVHALIRCQKRAKSGRFFHSDRDSTLPKPTWDCSHYSVDERLIGELHLKSRS